MRRPGFAAPSLLILAFLLVMALVGVAPAAAWQDATPPVAGTPAAQPTLPAAQPTEAAQPAETPAAPAATPAAEAAAPVQTDVVTLVLWYANSPDGEIINLFPLSTDAGFVAGPQAGAGGVGTADFPEDNIPTIVVGDSTFETYPRPDGVIERWTWFDDFEGARPGTLVMQLAGTSGTYQGYFGAATFVSRDEGGAGGVLTIVLRPPSPAAEPAEEEAPAEAPAEAAPAEEAIAPDVTAEPGDPVLPEPGVEGDVPAEGDAVAEPTA
jgi:hypothetical protein